MNGEKYLDVTKKDWYQTAFVLLIYIATLSLSAVLEDFHGLNGVNRKYLKCPKCGKRAWAKILRIKK